MNVLSNASKSSTIPASSRSRVEQRWKSSRRVRTFFNNSTSPKRPISAATIGLSPDEIGCELIKLCIYCWDHPLLYTCSGCSCPPIVNTPLCWYTRAYTAISAHSRNLHLFGESYCIQAIWLMRHPCWSPSVAKVCPVLSVLLTSCS